MHANSVSQKKSDKARDVQDFETGETLRNFNC